MYPIFLATAIFLKGMGANPDKLPNELERTQTIEKEFDLPLEAKKLFYFLWIHNHKYVGHSNLTFLEYGKKASTNLYLWDPSAIKKGLGISFLNQCDSYYFEYFNLKTLICEPYTLIQAPNATLPQLGFIKTKIYRTTPGTVNFGQEVNRWELKKENL